MKKLMSALLAVTLLFSTAGIVAFNDPISVEAKGYKSGKKSFNFQPNQQKQNSNFQKKNNDSTTVNKSTTKPTTKGTSSGGFMRGLFFGGLAGLLFGGLIANMGALGSVFGLAINILGILLVFWLIKKVFVSLTKKRDEESNPWRS